MNIRLHPLGYNAQATLTHATQNHDEFRKAIKSVIETMFCFHEHDYVHCDIRWPNITYDPDTRSYLVFDFENVRHLCCQVNCKKPEHVHSELDTRTCQTPFEDIKHIIFLFSRIKEKEKEVILFKEFDQKYDEYVKFAYQLEQCDLTQQLKKETKKIFWKLHYLLFDGKFLQLIFK